MNWLYSLFDRYCGHVDLHVLTHFFPTRRCCELVGDLLQPCVGHLEDADLVGRAEAVLHRPQDAEVVAAVALEGEHGVDHVLQHLGAGNEPLLGHVADEEQAETALRSEEHTSELQSLMRISYAVFCLKKKNNTK